MTSTSASTTSRSTASSPGRKTQVEPPPAHRGAVPRQHVRLRRGGLRRVPLRGGGAPSFDLFVVASSDLELPTAQRSVVEPAASANVLPRARSADRPAGWSRTAPRPITDRRTREARPRRPTASPARPTGRSRPAAAAASRARRAQRRTRRAQPRSSSSATRACPRRSSTSTSGECRRSGGTRARPGPRCRPTVSSGPCPRRRPGPRRCPAGTGGPSGSRSASARPRGDLGPRRRLHVGRPAYPCCSTSRSRSGRGARSSVAWLAPAPPVRPAAFRFCDRCRSGARQARAPARRSAPPLTSRQALAAAAAAGPPWSAPHEARRWSAHVLGDHRGTRRAGGRRRRRADPVEGGKTRADHGDPTRPPDAVVSPDMFMTWMPFAWRRRSPVRARRRCRRRSDAAAPTASSATISVTAVPWSGPGRTAAAEVDGRDGRRYARGRAPRGGSPRRGVARSTSKHPAAEHDVGRRSSRSRSRSALGEQRTSPARRRTRPGARRCRSTRSRRRHGESAPRPPAFSRRSVICSPTASSREPGRSRITSTRIVGSPRPSSARAANCASRPSISLPPQSPVSQPSAGYRAVCPSAFRPMELIPAPQTIAIAGGPCSPAWEQAKVEHERRRAARPTARGRGHAGARRCPPARRRRRGRTRRTRPRPGDACAAMCAITAATVRAGFARRNAPGPAEGRHGVPSSFRTTTSDFRLPPSTPRITPTRGTPDRRAAPAVAAVSPRRGRRRRPRLAGHVAPGDVDGGPRTGRGWSFDVHQRLGLLPEGLAVDHHVGGDARAADGATHSGAERGLLALRRRDRRRGAFPAVRHDEHDRRLCITVRRCPARSPRARRRSRPESGVRRTTVAGSILATRRLRAEVDVVGQELAVQLGEAAGRPCSRSRYSAVTCRTGQCPMIRVVAPCADGARALFSSSRSGTVAGTGS